MNAISNKTMKLLIKTQHNIQNVSIDKIQPINKETFSSEDEWISKQLMCGLILISECEPIPPVLKLNSEMIYEVVSGWESVMAYRACGLDEIPAIIRI